MIEKILISIIPHGMQRYETVGDYFINKNTLHINVSDTGNFFYNMLVALHELIEFILVQKNGIILTDIDKFDMEFEKERIQGKHKDNEEPGDDPKAPYYKQHQFATKLERKMGKELSVDWKTYERAIYALDIRNISKEGK